MNGKFSRNAVTSSASGPLLWRRKTAPERCDEMLRSRTDTLIRFGPHLTGFLFNFTQCNLSAQSVIEPDIRAIATTSRYCRMLKHYRRRWMFGELNRAAQRFPSGLGK